MTNYRHFTKKVRTIFENGVCFFLFVLVSWLFVYFVGWLFLVAQMEYLCCLLFQNSVEIVQRDIIK